MKYSAEQLRTMAGVALEAKASLDPRYLQLVITLSGLFNIPVDEVERCIKEMAA